VKRVGGTPLGLVAEYASPEQLLAAVAGMRARGYRLLDAFVPYPVKGLEEALALRRSGLNWLAFAAGLFGAGFAFWLQWFVNHRLYRLNIGGRPSFAIPVFIIIAFETMVLFAGVTSFASLFWVCRLPRLSHPLFAVDGFQTVTLDRFWLGVNADDPCFDPEGTEEAFRSFGAMRVEMARGLS
jgi:Protein of unknown function (DUF3341)